MILFGRVLNGMGLGIVQPLLLSLVADKHRPTKRGMAFGSLFFTGSVCNTVFTLLATRYAATTVAGVACWRISILAVAVFSAVVGVLIYTIVIEPQAVQLAERRRQYTVVTVFTKNLPKVWSLFKYPSFVLILCQGAPGTAPWTVFPFFTQWLELSCFTHAEAAWIFSAFGWGTAFSSVLSGGLLNYVARRFPDHGPPSIANFSVASGIPYLLLLFVLLPKPADLGDGAPYIASYVITFLFFGMGAAMCGTVNKKVFSDIVPPEIYTYVFAMDQLIENGIGNFAGLAVGVLTDKVFHYDESHIKDGTCSPEEARKLGLGMFVVCTIAWAVCFTVYLGLHCTYPKDRRRQLALRSQALQDKLPKDVESVPSSSEASICGLDSESPSTQVAGEEE